MDPAQLLESLVRIPSPTGREHEAVAFLRERAKADGFQVSEDAAGNFVAEAGRGERFLLFVGHIDTVPGEIPVRRENGTLWGRGAVDAKGPLVAAYCAALRHLEDPDIRIRLIGAVDEEGLSRGARGIQTEVPPEWILVGEPSGARGLTLGYKGILRGRFRVQRERHHGAHRETSAADDAFGFWRHVQDQYRFRDSYDALQGRLDSLQSQSDGLVDHVEATFNIRLPPGTEPAILEDELSVIAAARSLHLEFDERIPAAETPRRGPLVAAFLEAIRSRGAEPQLKRKTGTADFNILAHRFPGVPIAAYGPGDAALDHTPHERLQLAELKEAIDVLDRVFRRLAGTAQNPVLTQPYTTIDGDCKPNGQCA